MRQREYIKRLYPFRFACGDWVEYKIVGSEYRIKVNGKTVGYCSGYDKITRKVAIRQLLEFKEGEEIAAWYYEEDEVSALLEALSLMPDDVKEELIRRMYARRERRGRG